MPSFSFDSTDVRMMLGVAHYHPPWSAHTDERFRDQHIVVGLVNHSQSDDIMCGMHTWISDSTHSKTTQGVACHMALRKHTRPDDVECGMTTSPFGQPTRSYDVANDMLSSPLERTQSRTTSSMACHYTLGNQIA